MGSRLSRGGDRRRVIGAALVLAGLETGTTGPASASAWNRAAGTGLVIADVTLSGGSDFFDGLGRLAPSRAYSKREIAGYVEYGATDAVMLVARPGFDMTAIGAPGAGRDAGFGGLAAGAQYQALVYGPAVLAVQATFRLPGTTSRRNPADIGNTAREADLRVLAGVGFGLLGHEAFVDIQQSARLRSGGAAAQWHSDLTFGLRATSRLLFLLQAVTVVPLGPGTPWFPSARSTKLGLTGVYDLSEAVSVDLGVFTTVSGRDALRERGFLTGLWYRF